MPSGMGEKENSAKAEGLLLGQWKEKVEINGEQMNRMHEQHIFLYKKRPESSFLKLKKTGENIGEAQENLTGWRRIRDDLLRGVGVDESAAGCVDVGDVGEVELVEGEVDWTGIGFKNLRLRQ